MILAIDLDGVIHDPNNKEPGKKLGKPIKGAVDAVNKLYTEGNHIIIHTVWASSAQRIQAINQWLAYFGIMYHEITNQKPDADWYIDNKALHFDDWTQVLTALSGEPKDS